MAEARQQTDAGAAGDSLKDSREVARVIVDDLRSPPRSDLAQWFSAAPNLEFAWRLAGWRKKLCPELRTPG